MKEFKPVVPTEPKPFLELEAIKDLIKNRNIRPEHYPLLERLIAEVPKDVVLENHNAFSGTGSSGQDRLVKKFEAEEKRHASTAGSLHAERAIWYQVMLEIIRAYDWTAAWNTNVVLERLPREVFKNEKSVTDV